MKNEMLKIRHYTMGELMMTLVIIILLITIIMPVVMKSREWGASIQCKGNLKSIMAGIVSYTNDYQGYLPMQANNYYYTVALKDNWMGKLVTHSNLACTGNYLPSAKLGPTPTDAYKNIVWSNKSSIWTCPKESLITHNQYLKSLANRPATADDYPWYYTHYAANAGMFLNGDAYGHNKLQNWSGRAWCGNYQLSKIRAIAGDAPGGSQIISASIYGGGGNYISSTFRDTCKLHVLYVEYT